MKANRNEKGEYQRLTDGDFDTPTEQEFTSRRVVRTQNSFSLVWFASGAVASILVTILAFVALIDRSKNGTCAAYSSRWSPIVRDVDIKYDLITYDGRFKKENIYRQDAGPDVDAAWLSLGTHLRPIQLGEDDAMKAGLTHSHVRINKKYGGGYPVNMEGLHHLHCLNLLRQATYFNYDYYKAKGKGAFENNGKILKLHVTHCLDTLRQQLMCTTDTGVLGRVWYNHSDPTPFVDFNTRHKCKNYDAILQWAQEHQMKHDPETIPDDFLEPPAEGDIILAAIP